MEILTIYMMCTGSATNRCDMSLWQVTALCVLVPKQFAATYRDLLLIICEQSLPQNSLAFSPGDFFGWNLSLRRTAAICQIVSWPLKKVIYHHRLITLGQFPLLDKFFIWKRNCFNVRKAYDRKCYSSDLDYYWMISQTYFVFFKKRFIPHKDFFL